MISVHVSVSAMIKIQQLLLDFCLMCLVAFALAKTGAEKAGLGDCDPILTSGLLLYF